MEPKNDQTLWTEKYRPRTIKECILPIALKKQFQAIIDKKKLPNMILSGTPGCGKTTVVQAMAEELGADFLKINASRDGNIDTLRGIMAQFCSTVSLGGGRKILLLDEADYMNPNSLQPALRGAIESYGRNTGFVLTLNKKNRVMEAIHSRCPVIDFKFPNNEKQVLAKEFFDRLKYILKNENIKCTDDKILVELIIKHFPDMRQIVGILQQYSNTGVVDVGILSQLSDIKVSELIKYLKEKDFSKVRKWVVENGNQDSSFIYRTLYDTLYDQLQPQSIPEAILIIADYLYKDSFVADSEINLAACLIQLMVEVSWK
jgi:DNA polymerase III delta prime subunit